MQRINLRWAGAGATDVCLATAQHLGALRCSTLWAHLERLPFAGSSLHSCVQAKAGVRPKVLALYHAHGCVCSSTAAFLRIISGRSHRRR